MLKRVKTLLKWNKQHEQKLLAAANTTVATVVDNSIPTVPTVVDNSNSTVATTIATDSDSTVVKPKSYDVYVTVNVINWELCIFPGYYV